MKQNKASSHTNDKHKQVDKAYDRCECRRNHISALSDYWISALRGRFGNSITADVVGKGLNKTVLGTLTYSENRQPRPTT